MYYKKKTIKYGCIRMFIVVLLVIASKRENLNVIKTA